MRTLSGFYYGATNTAATSSFVILPAATPSELQHAVSAGLKY